ncbi:MAG TPA: hypothetical protein VF633_09920 [Brevundimonas sp.]|jgi:hypothetical protein
MIELLASLIHAPAQGFQLDGSLIRDDQSCYTITMTRDGASTPVGVTLQTIDRVQLQGRPALRIVVHQSVNSGAFDMRDTFTLDAATLAPIRLENDRKGQRHVTLDYAADRVIGSRLEDGVSKPVDVALPGTVWEGNLFGVTFAALPLAAGATFSIPFYQYDKGVGAFAVRVAGEEVVTTPQGPVDAWTLDVSTGAGPGMTYLIAKADRRELGYRTPRGGQTLGGDCSALIEASSGG